MLLLAGCSYLHNPYLPSIIAGSDSYELIAKGSAGNEFIAKSVIYNIRRTNYKKVFILWSGLIRLDLEVSNTLDLSGVDEYRKTQRDQRTWFHSGGLEGGCLKDPAVPKWIKNHFQQQYLTLDYDLIQSQSLYHISTCLNTLEAQGIDYRFGFIYDIHKPDNGQYSLGKEVLKTHPLVHLIPWKKSISSTPYDYCLEHGLLSEDRFHPSEEGYQKWWDSVGLQL